MCKEKILLSSLLTSMLAVFVAFAVPWPEGLLKTCVLIGVFCLTVVLGTVFFVETIFQFLHNPQVLADKEASAFVEKINAEKSWFLKNLNMALVVNLIISIVIGAAAIEQFPLYEKSGLWVIVLFWLLCSAFAMLFYVTFLFYSKKARNALAQKKLDRLASSYEKLLYVPVDFINLQLAGKSVKEMKFLDDLFFTYHVNQKMLQEAENIQDANAIYTHQDKLEMLKMLALQELASICLTTMK